MQVNLSSTDAWGKKDIRCIHFGSKCCMCQPKQKWHRPGFRQGIGALPLLSLPWKLESCCIRLMYTAIYTQPTALDRMLVSNPFESIGKSFQVEIFILSWMDIDWTGWPWVIFIQSAEPSGRRKVMPLQCETPTMIHTQWYRQQASACSAAGRWSRSTPRRWSETSSEFAAHFP